MDPENSDTEKKNTFLAEMGFSTPPPPTQVETSANNAFKKNLFTKFGETTVNEARFCNDSPTACRYCNGLRININTGE